MSQTMLTVALPIALAWMMYCVGLTLSTADFKRVGQYPGRVLMGLVAQLLGLPLLAYVIITLFALPEPVAIGLWLLALAPGGAFVERNHPHERWRLGAFYQYDSGQ